MKTYSELIKIPDFFDRLAYLKLDGKVGEDTFGHLRFLNQSFYRSTEWRKFRNSIILRDNACDLAHADYAMLAGRIIIHHINPITPYDLRNGCGCLMDPENSICVSHNTHLAIHFSDESLIPQMADRSPGDTKLW